MPIYEYSCPECGSRFEKMTSYAEADKVSCSECGSESAKRQLSVFGVGASQPEPTCQSGACSLPDGAPSCASGACPGMMGM